MRAIILAIILLIACGYVLYSRLQIVGLYQGIQFRFTGVYVGQVWHPDVYELNQLVTEESIPWPWTGYTYFHSTSFMAKPGGLDPEVVGLYGATGLPYFTDREYKRVKDPKPVDSWRWEAVDENGVYHAYVLQLWYQNLELNIAMSYVEAGFWGNVGKFQPVTVWIKAEPVAKSYFTEPGCVAHFTLAEVEVLNVQRVEPTQDLISSGKIAVEHLGDFITPVGANIAMYPYMYAGVYDRSMENTWNYQSPELYIDSNGDGVPDAYLEPDVWKKYWYLPLDFSSLASVGRDRPWGVEKWRESYKITLHLAIVVCGEWVGKRIDDIPLQPYEVRETVWTWIEKVKEFIKDIIKDPIMLLATLLILVILLAILAIMFPAFGACCIASASSIAGKRYEVGRILRDLRWFRDNRMTGFVGRQLRKWYYNVSVVLVRTVNRYTARVYWGTIKILHRII